MVNADKRSRESNKFLLLESQTAVESKKRLTGDLVLVGNPVGDYVQLLVACCRLIYVNKEGDTLNRNGLPFHIFFSFKN